MVRRFSHLVALLLISAISVSAQFFTPQRRDEVWRVGEQRTIRYYTKITNYTIALWQEAPSNNFAIRGPILVETTEGPENSFDWTVQTYDFDLEASNVFFFWLIKGDRSRQGKPTADSISSPYFQIVDEPPPPEESSTSTSSLSPSTTTSTSSSAAPSSTSENSDSSTQPPSPTQTADDAADPPTSSSRDGDGDGDGDGGGGGGGLSVGAQAGIGVGAAVVALTCIFFAVLWYRYVRRQQRVLAELREAISGAPPPPPAMSSHMTAAQYYTPHAGMQPPLPPPPLSPDKLAELSGTRGAVEIGPSN